MDSQSSGTLNLAKPPTEKGGMFNWLSTSQTHRHDFWRCNRPATFLFFFSLRFLSCVQSCKNHSSSRACRSNSALTSGGNSPVSGTATASGS